MEKRGVKNLLPDLREDIWLKDYTTFKIGGRAKYFFIAKDKEDLIRAIKTAKKMKLPFFVLSGGSNLLVSDKGYKGLVIKIQSGKYKIQGDKIYIEAGAKLCALVGISKGNSLTGLEWAAGIPGTVGGAIYGNAGAFGSCIADSVENITALNSNTLKTQVFNKKDCKFANKNSIFKLKTNLIIIGATFKLKKGNKKDIENKIKENLNYRKENHPLGYPSAGCAFKNWDKPITNGKYLAEFPELKEFNKKGIIPTAYLIDKCGLKGKKIGGAQISEKHANFIINLGGAKASDVLRLIKLAKEKVKNKFGINLEEELQIIL